MILTNHSDVVSLFTTYTLEDGSIVKIDKQLASERVRTCMNTLKKHVDTASTKLVMISIRKKKTRLVIKINVVVDYFIILYFCDIWSQNLLLIQ